MAARPSDHPEIQLGKIGVLIVNLGTPDAATPEAVRRYLGEFLSDKRVVDLPRALWLPILHGVILNVRPRITARNYQKIWRIESDESPLRYFTRKQADALQQSLDDTVTVSWAMRYGNPSISNQLEEMKAAGCDRILVVPLYPQYSATTTASVHDAVFDAVRAMRWQPALRIAPSFCDEEDYINALAEVAGKAISKMSAAPEKIIISFHGIPERYFRAGDPYHCHCQKTARLLREKMGWSDDFAPLAFQSKFGREKWLEPATDQMIEDCASAGVKSLAVITPAFVSDCIETLEEIDLVGRAAFRDGGGETFMTIPCVNIAPGFIDFLSGFITRELGGWR